MISRINKRNKCYAQISASLGCGAFTIVVKKKYWLCHVKSNKKTTLWSKTLLKEICFDAQ
jgi:hypothetical protein